MVSHVRAVERLTQRAGLHCGVDSERVLGTENTSTNSPHDRANENRGRGPSGRWNVVVHGEIRWGRNVSYTSADRDRSVLSRPSNMLDVGRRMPGKLPYWTRT